MASHQLVHLTLHVINISTVHNLQPSLYVGATAVTTGFTNSVGTIVLDNVACVGTEARLLDCRSDALGTFDCIDTENAGVQCELGKPRHN